MNFKIKDGEKIRTVIADKHVDTVIPAGSLVKIDTGLIVPAVAKDKSVAYSHNGAPAGTTKVEVSLGNDFTLVGDTSAVFAVTHKGGSYELKANQVINFSGTNDVALKVDISEDAGVVGVKGAAVRIINPLF